MVSLTSGVVTGVVVGAIAVVTGVPGASTPAQADPTTPTSGSSITVSANQQDKDLDNAPMPDLSVTVSQTKDLLAQGIKITWTGGLKSDIPTNATGGADFLQIAQCWGADDDDEPDRTKCQYGGFGTPGAYRYSTTTNPDDVAEQDEEFTAYSDSPFNPTFTGIPFQSATGDWVRSVEDGERIPDVDPAVNQFFTKFNTNEVAWAGSSTDGTGSATFEVQTATESPGLGCGTPVNQVTGGVKGSSCWLVIIPRGTNDVGQQFVVNSGLSWDAWKHRIAVKLEFQPIGVRCTIGAAERQLAGSELVSDAVRSWQPELCGAEDGAAYSLIGQTESDALLAANGTTAAPMALTTRALKAPDIVDRLSYAPVALTGLAISFAVDRQPSAAEGVPQEVTDAARLPFTELKLTPRLIAKLLTNSYVDSLPPGADRSGIGYVDQTSPGHNARNLTSDPEFLEINDPEWAYQAITAPSVADLLTPLGRLDGAWVLWNYVISDAEALAFLSGEADEWGMIVNPWSSTTPSEGNGGIAASYPLDQFPRADPIEQPAVEGPDGAAAVNLVTWRPYTNNLDQSANLTLRGDGLILGGWDITATPPKYGKAARQVPGQQSVLGLTDTSAAAKYQVYTAALLNPAGEYVAPDSGSLLAAASAMVADPAQPQVVGYDPTSTEAAEAPGAYPLAMPVYAAVNPQMKDANDGLADDRGAGELRGDYASFIAFAVSSGQVPGTGTGQLPDGYAPLPQAWRDQAVAAAETIAAGPVATPAPTTTPRSTTTTTPPRTTGALPPAVVAPAAAAPQNPAATGQAAGSLVGAATPVDANISAVSGAVPIALLAGLLAALAAAVLPRVRRRL
ncbi:hypothetical protein GCM10009851_04030 [Herbiconiux moechotypicola]|uniref:PBP domain-containing protein n=1 Tax=Herbiconiux moechotypicola TaxID=637393 RepID=A0ABN3D8Y8_9MICO